jgi:hypothetical protein
MEKKVKEDRFSFESLLKDKKKITIISICALVLLVLIVLIIVLVSLLQKEKENEVPKLTTCELNNYSCFNNSCLTGYTEMNMACKTGQACCKKIPVGEKSQCERAGLNCYKNSCPFGYADIDLFCGGGNACCKKIVVESRAKCELQGFQCFESILPEPACPTNYISLNISCRTGEICCKPDSQKNKTLVIYGYVKIKKGNCMPPVGPNCTTTPLITEVAVFSKTLESQMSGNYFRTAAGPIKMVYSNESGYYEIELPYGDYSVFAKDPEENNDYYCNTMVYGGAMCYVPLTNSKQFDILIDHSTQ